MEYFNPFLLVHFLSACPLLFVPSELPLKLISSFSDQLERNGEWQLACAVCMFHPYDLVRTELVRLIISRHVSELYPKLEYQNLSEFTSFILNDPSFQYLFNTLHISSNLVFSELVLFARANDDVKLEIMCQFALANYSRAFDLLFRYYMYSDLMEGRSENVAANLQLFEGHEEEVQRWATLGSVVKNYLKFMKDSETMSCESALDLLQQIEDMKKEEDLFPGNQMIRLVQELSYQVLNIVIEMLRKAERDISILTKVGLRINSLGNFYMKKSTLQASLEEILMSCCTVCPKLSVCGMKNCEFPRLWTGVSLKRWQMKNSNQCHIHSI